MATYVQANRLIAIDTPLGKDVLLLRSMSGQEAISQLFTFELDLLSSDAVIKFEDIVGKRVTIRTRIGDDKERFFNGFISRFMQLGSDTGLANYRATMVPWLWFLTRTTDCRIFQNLSIPDIIKKIFSDLGFTDHKFSLKGTYEPWDYCVQYRESDFNFVTRLMEQEGIFFYFEHEEKKHTLVIADTPSVHQPCPGQASVRWNPHGSKTFEESVVTSLELHQEFRPGKYALTDYNFETPSTSLYAQVQTTIQVADNTKYEIYDFPGEYEKKAEGDALTKIRIQEEEAQQLEVTGSSTCRTFSPGYRFKLEEYMRKDMNKEYVLTEVQHQASVGDTYTSGEAGGMEDTYTNHFTCIPYTVPYRARRITPRPVVQGPQTAVVVGPAGEEIWVDKYGRVKVQFFWDREGKKDENSSCWVRVSQLWAGKQWGAMFIPRIGQEVIVEFMEGDPDQPIITGRVYNAELMPPYVLPDNKTQSGIKSRSSKGGSPDNFNEIRFEDKKGNEEVYIHAEKDWRIFVEHDKDQVVDHDETLSVTNNRTKKVGVDEKQSIGKDRTTDIGSNESLTVGLNKTEMIMINSAETVGAAKELTVGGLYQITVGGVMNATVAGAKTSEVGGFSAETVGGSKSEVIGGSKSFSSKDDLTETVGKSQSTSISDNLTLTVNGKRTEQVAKEFGLTAKSVHIVAEDEIVLQTGDAKIIMKKNGDITIDGKKIQVTGSGDVIIKGSKVAMN
jgi:type VI secretion system secreted protein VgrG